MASESGEVATSMKRATTKGNDQQQPEQLPCPRCDSTNTKFCYYNNYNFSQPRHFCKSCRRYWTHGGALRDIPVGGGSRKTAKRSRTSSSYSSTSTSTSATNPFFMGSASPNALLLPLPTAATTSSTSSSTTTSSNVNMCGSFTSLLNTPGPTGFLALGGFGLGLDDMGCFGLGRGIGWTFPGHAVEDGNGAFGVMVGNGGAAGGASGISAVGNAWQFEGAENGFIGHVGAGVGSGGGDCFSWPDLAISTPGNGLK